MKINFIDKLKILTIGAIKVDEYTANIEDKLVQFFNSTKYLYSRTNLFGQLLNVTKDIANLLFNYHESAVIENNVLTAQKEVSLRHFAELSGLNIVRSISSTGVIRLEVRPTFFSKYGNPIYIRKYAQLSNDSNSLIYLVDINDDQKIINTTSSIYYIPVIQGYVKTSTFISDGTKLFTISLSDNEIIEQSHIKITVNGETYVREDSLFDMTYNEKSYFIKTGFLDQYQIIFGNGLNGNIPSKGASITVEYLTSVGESGNFDENSFPKFTFISGVFDSNGENIDISEYSSIIKDSGFNLGSNGDSTDSLRKTIGYNSRANILLDPRSIYAYLSKYSFLSKINVWTNDSDRRINNILLLPNIYNKLDSYDEYFTRPIEDFYLNTETQTTIINNITTSELSHISNEIVWVDPIFRKYVVMIYIDSNDTTIYKTELYNQIKEVMVDIFINSSFTRDVDSQDLSKSYTLSKIQELVNDDCRISLIFVSEQNENAKINGFYQTTKYVNGKEVLYRVEVPFGTDPHLGLTDRNDIDCSYRNEVPILRGGFNILSKTNEQFTIMNAINLYIKEGDNWVKVE